MQTIILRLTVLLFAATLTFVLAGCQTTKGFGKDVEHLGENIQEGAKK